MPVITLTSDWNQNDYYLAAVKGQILQQNEKLIVVDINHKIRPFDTRQAAFILRNSFKYFPEGSVHINFVNSELTGDSVYCAIEAFNHYFIGNDNGIFSLILNGPADKIVKLQPLEEDEYSSFPGLKTFTAAACDLLQNNDIEKLGEPLESLNERIPLRATIEENSITGTVIYTDSYGNVTTNIKKELFDRIGKAKSFEIYVQSKHYVINHINNNYSAVPSGEMVAVFNSAGLLEIAINNGNANKLLNLGINSNIRIEFLDQEG